ncbi:hypothetical protein H8K35_14850 [Undibacterium sp. LX40W]|uniref:Uncharacterized protein n=1 Tax=Undibacterium nitidum TaxID=2762298 RepID=A0A923HRK0_9BURK|nr:MULTISPECIES: hypothetical protein [Undibacterium]MBC3882668.1 hypothetical protein [Undibacterium nitidum]MBC3892949.1 hypothetical protein [Undibacterium sp. LX40W]
MSITLFSLAACFDKAQMASSRDKKSLQAHAGYYVDTQLLEDVKKTKFWKIPNFVSAVNIDKSGGGAFIFSWHEGSWFEESEEKVMVFKGDSIKFMDEKFSTSTFIKVANAADTLEDVRNYDPIFFSLIFDGCYLDQSNRQWCFSQNKIKIEAKTLEARLVLDRSELPQDGNIVDIETEKLFWIFKPEKDGWLVLKGDYVSRSGGKPLNWNKPWMKLRPKK